MENKKRVVLNMPHQVLQVDEERNNENSFFFISHCDTKA